MNVRYSVPDRDHSVNGRYYIEIKEQPTCATKNATSLLFDSFVSPAKPFLEDEL